MSSAAGEPLPYWNPARGGELCIVGLGNPERGDDGLGPQVVEGLAGRLVGAGRARLLTRRGPDPDLVDELREAGLIILVDASVEELPGGRRWQRIEPRAQDVPFLTHDLPPGFLLWLIAQVHQRRPEAWLVSVQGEDFGCARGLSAPAQARARRVMDELVNLVSREG